MDQKHRKIMAKYIGLMTRTCKHRPHCSIACVSGGPVPQVPECTCWADHLKKEASSIERRKNPNIEYDFS